MWHRLQGMIVAMEAPETPETPETPEADEVVDPSVLLARTSREIRKGVITLIVGVILFVVSYLAVEGQMPELTIENMLDFDNPRILSQYQLWGSLLVTYVGGMIIFVNIRLRKQSQV
jgi:hypothetical protein